MYQGNHGSGGGNSAENEKRTMKKLPKGIELNTAGMVIKSREGPAAGSNPKANTAGNMAIPASSETRTSASITLIAL